MSTPTRPAPPPPPMRKGQVQAYEAIESYTAQRECELSFEDGDLIFVHDQTDADWWMASLNDKRGLIPSTHVSSDNARTPLVDAARRGNLAMLEECLGTGMSVNSLDKSGSSALHAAAQAGHLMCVERLLKEPRVELDLQNKMGDTPIHCAAYRGHGDIVQLLLQHGAKTDIANRDCYTPRDLARRGTVIAILDEKILSNKRKSSTFDSTEYGLHDSEDSD